MAFLKKSLSLLLATLILLPVCGDLFPVSAQSEQTLLIDDELPTVYINTDSGKNPERDDNSVYFEGSMRIELNGYYADCTNAYTTDQMKPIGIKTRGNSTRTFAGAVDTGKYSYRLKLSEKADLFGMGASKNWALLANVYDQTNVRNTMAYELAKALGVACCDSTWVVLYLNGQYRGLYQLCETVGIAKTRLDITDWGDLVEDVAKAIAKREKLDSAAADRLEDAMEADLSWVTSGKFQNYKISDYYNAKFDITGGYLIEYDSFDNPHDARPFLFDGGTTPAGVELKIDIPETAYTNREMLEYVRSLILNFEEAVTSPNFRTADGRHYSEFCDLDSLVSFYLVNEVMMNGEYGIRSMFFYIEDGKIHWGPVWDFDCAAGNSITVTTSWEGQIGTGDGRNHWYKALYNDSYFMTLVQNRLADVRESLYSMLESAQIYRKYIEKEARRDFVKYGNRYFGSPENKLGTFDEEYDFYQKWQKNRIEWVERTYLGGGYSVIGATPYSDKIGVQAVYADSGDPLPADTLTQYSAKSDFVYDPQIGGSVGITLSTSHTTSMFTDIYVNGKYKSRIKLRKGKDTTFTLSADQLCLKDGARNTVHLVVYNQSGDPYRRFGFSVLCHSGGVPTLNQAVVQIRDGIWILKKGESLTLPDSPAPQKGFSFVGWTDGEKVYAPGSQLKITRNLSLYAKWTHTDGKSILYAESTPILYANAYQTPDSSNPPPTSSAPPTSPDPQAPPATSAPNGTDSPSPRPNGDAPEQDGDPSRPTAWIIALACTVASAALVVCAVLVIRKMKKK